MVTLSTDHHLSGGRNVILDLPRGSKSYASWHDQNFMRELECRTFRTVLVGNIQEAERNVTQRIKNVNEWKREETNNVILYRLSQS